ncbi:MAG: hypothetical protein KDB80_10185 [Planctomycetes bacterium]|nr:hypothetical protein [Planctomycetota bacterium]
MHRVSILTILLLSAVLPAQTVWTANDDASFQNALQLAAPGDIIDVTGTVGHFQTTKPLTIRGDADVTVGQYVGTTLAPEGGVLRIVGLRFTPPALARYDNAWIKVTSGTVFLEDVIVTMAQPAQTGLGALRVEGTAHVVAIGCRFSGGGGGGPGLRATGLSHVSAVDCRFDGGDGGCDPWGACQDGFDGILMLYEGTSLQLSGCTVNAGDGGDPVPSPLGYALPGKGIWAAGSRVWVSDSTVRGGNAGTHPGGNALHATGIGHIEVARSTLIPGTGTPDGSATFGDVVVDASLIGAWLDGPLVVGTRTDLSILAPTATMPFAIVMSLTLERWEFPISAQPLWWGSPGSLWIQLYASSTVAGAATMPIRLPNDPVVRDIAVWFHVFGGTSLPVASAPVVGGVIR